MKEQRRTLRNALWILLERFGLVLSGLLFAALVPRLMGPEWYGRFALLFAGALWFVMLTHLGADSILACYLPEMRRRGHLHEEARLFGNLLSLRFAAASLSALCCVTVMLIAFDGADPLLLAGFGGFVLLASLTETVYSLFLGLNQAPKWGLSFLLRRWLMVATVPAGFAIKGLSGAGIGLLAGEAAVLSLGIHLARSHIAPLRPRLEPRYLFPFLKFGVLLFGAALLGNTFRFSGEALVRILSGSFVAVGYYGISVSLYAAAEMAVHQLFHVFTPYLSSLQPDGETEQVALWVERLLRGASVILVSVPLGAFALAEGVIPWLLGDDFRPVVANVRMLSLSLLAIVPLLAANLAALAAKRPRICLSAAAVRLGVFWVAGVPLAGKAGSLGACAAVLVATAASGAFATWKVRRIHAYSLWKWLLTLLLAAPFIVLSAVGPTYFHGLDLWLASLGMYLGTVMLTGLVTPGEIRELMRHMRG